MRQTKYDPGGPNLAITSGPRQSITINAQPFSFELADLFHVFPLNRCLPSSVSESRGCTTCLRRWGISNGTMGICTGADTSLQDARWKMKAWRRDYNEQRSRSALNYRTPAEFARASGALSLPLLGANTAERKRRQGFPAAADAGLDTAPVLLKQTEISEKESFGC